MSNANTIEQKIQEPRYIEKREQLFDSLGKEKNKEQKTREKTKYIIGNYTVNESGLYYNPPQQLNEEPKEPIYISSPIYPESYLRDADGKSHSLLIRIFDGEVDHLWAMPRKLIMDWGELSKTLLDLGQIIPTHPANQKLLQNFLMSAKPDKKMRCVDKAGWHGKQYVFPDGEVTGEEEEGESVYPITQVCPEGIRQSGTLKEWQDNVVAICKNNSRMILSLGIAFASPCAELANEDSGGINLKGKSSIGKTRCLMVAVSVFGSPKYQRSWKTTGNALEGICSLYNDALLPLDEFGQADAKEVGDIAYMVSQGQGKGRMRSNSTLQKIKTWRVMVISTGEVGLAEHMQEKNKRARAGQVARFADIPAEITGGYGCFEDIHGEQNGADFATRVKDVCGKYYGTASREFIKKLTDNQEEARRDLKNYIEDFIADNSRGCDGQVARVAGRFGLIYASLALAAKYRVLGGYIRNEEAKEGVTACFNAWLENRGTKGSLETYQTKESVIGKLLEYSDSRFPSLNFSPSEEHKTFQQIWGYKDKTTFYILSEAFKTHICQGENSTEVAKVLHEAGLLGKDKDGKFSTSKYIPSLGKNARVYPVQIEKEGLANE